MCPDDSHSAVERLCSSVYLSSLAAWISAPQYLQSGCHQIKVDFHVGDVKGGPELDTLTYILLAFVKKKMRRGLVGGLISLTAGRPLDLSSHPSEASSLASGVGPL